MAGNRWTKEEIDSLLYQIRVEQRPLPQLQVPEKSQAAINNRRQRLKRAGWLDGAFTGRQLAPWTIRELNELTKLTREYGFSAALIAQLQLLPGRTANAIGKMMARHGLGNPEVKRRSRIACRLPAAKRAQLQQFLLNEGRLLSSACVAAEWGLAAKTIAAYRRRVGVPLTWNEARSSEEYQLEQRNRGRAFSKQLHARWAEWRDKREQRLRHVRASLERSPNPPPLRRCCACGEQWFATEDFFYVTRKRDGASFSMSQTCRLCRSAKRRHQNAVNKHEDYRTAA
jgi:hypothetical protein